MSVRDALSRSTSRRYEEGDVPGINARYRGQSLTTSEIRAFRNSFSNAKGELIKSRGDRLNELLVAQFLVDDAGKREFTDEEVMAGAMDGYDGAAIAFLFARAKAWIGFANDDDWTAIENAAKN